MIVVGGDNLIDLIQTAHLDAQVDFSGKRGGSCYNTAMALGRQNAETGFIAPISTDSLGMFLADGLTQSDVSLLGSRLDAPSSMAVVTFENGQPRYQFYRDGTAERLVDAQALKDQMPKGARAFHIASLALTDGADAEVWEQFFYDQYNAGLVTTLDPNVRAMMVRDRDAYLTRILKMSRHTDILKFSDEDLEFLFPDLDQDAGFEKICSETSASLIVMTKGADGAIGRAQGQQVEVAAANMGPIKDTVGAGDTFMATLIAECDRRNVLSRTSLQAVDAEMLQAIMEVAAKAAALNCTKEGCDPPSLSDLSL